MCGSTVNMKGLFSAQEDVMDLNRRLTIIDSQLRKSELTRKHLEISNKKLIGFAQVIYTWCIC